MINYFKQIIVIKTLKIVKKRLTRGMFSLTAETRGSPDDTVVAPNKMAAAR